MFLIFFLSLRIPCKQIRGSLVVVSPLNAEARSPR